MAIEARYDGWCSACKSEIDQGDLIAKDGDDGPWVHEECA